MLQPCQVNTSSSMNCLTPNVTIPKGIDLSDMNQRQLEFILGFLLDGAKSYKNLSDTKDMIDYAKVTYFADKPQSEISEFEPFVPNSGMKIAIKVSYHFISS
jgi:hypothetical protein